MIVTGHEREATDFINAKMLEVKSILDEIADETGVLFVCLDNRVVELVYKLGTFVGESLLECHKVVADRVVLANNHIEYEYDWLEKHPEAKKGETNEKAKD